MKSSGLRTYTLTYCVALAVLAGCGGSSVGCASGALPPSATIAARTAQGARQQWSESVIYAFQHLGGNYRPYAGLINVNGTLYGTTSGGDGSGAVYSISPSGPEKIVHAFRGGSDGLDPEDTLVDVGGVLYGTTMQGGDSECGQGYGCGTVFAIDPSSAGTEKVLYRFHGGLDGAVPYAGLVAIHGTLYGTTAGGGASFGGVSSCRCGTVFSINPASGRERILYRFKGGSDGRNPYGNLLALRNTLYGTTYVGGSSHCANGLPGCGTVFSLNIASQRERIVHVFQGSPTDGANPTSGLTLMRGRLYGTTVAGGIATCTGFQSSPCGTVFSMEPSSGQEDIVHFFKGDPDGLSPNAPLVASNGFLYGTTYYGGDSGSAFCGESGCGTVFRLTAEGKERVLYSFQFTPDGAYPTAGLTSVNGALYGTTVFGGTGAGDGGGTVFKLSP